MEDLGHNYFQELASRSLFQISSKGNSLYIMHDLVTDLARWAAGSSSCSRLEDMQNYDPQLRCLPKVRHSSHIRGKYDGVQKFEVYSKATCLRTFLPLALSDPLSDCRYLALKLSSLKELYIQRMDAVESIGVEFYGDGYLPFHALETLEFQNLKNWKKWSPFQLEGTRVFSCLKKLSIRYFPNLEGSLPEKLDSLAQLKIDGCEELVVSISNYKQLHELDIEDCKGQPLSPIHSSRQASTLVADFLAANAPVGSIGAIASPMQWFPPPVGTFKVNVDASWHPPNRTGIGVVIRDSDRRVIAGTSFSCRSSSVIEAEATASLAGIDLAASLQLMEIIMETDAKEVVEEILSNQRKVCWKSYLIIQQIRSKSSGFSNCYWEWIPREANAVAHAAAMLGKGLVDPLRWASQPPPNLTLVLRNDGLPCPHS
ncbi:hypothetical protein ACLB2K_075039 [Fragaria x ananassa]